VLVFVLTFLDHLVALALVRLVDILVNAQLDAFDGHLVPLLVESLDHISFELGVVDADVVPVLSARMEEVVEPDGLEEKNGLVN